MCLKVQYRSVIYVDFRKYGALIFILERNYCILFWFYCVTGNTPQRRDFSYPRVLVATSPHERILARFRETNGAALPDLSIPEVSLNNTVKQWILIKITALIFAGCRRLHFYYQDCWITGVELYLFSLIISVCFPSPKVCYPEMPPVM